MEKRKSTAKTGGKIDPVDGWTFNLAEATGTNARSLQHRLISQLIRTLWLPDDLSKDAKFKRIKSAIAAMVGIKPEDEIEGLLAVQIPSTGWLSLLMVGPELDTR